MKKKNLIFAATLALITVISFLFISQKPVEGKNFKVETLIKNLDTPWAIDFLPYDRMIRVRYE